MTETEMDVFIKSELGHVGVVSRRSSWGWGIDEPWAGGARSYDIYTPKSHLFPYLETFEVASLDRGESPVWSKNVFDTIEDAVSFILVKEVIER
jgi:hypothetical protein